MRGPLLCVLALAAGLPVTDAHAQARTNIVVAPRILSPDTPHFRHVGSDQTFCVKQTKEKPHKRPAKLIDERQPCRTE